MLEVLEITVVLEGDADSGYSAYSPDFPGVYATGRTESIVRKRMASGIAFHCSELRASGESLPEPHIKTYTLAVQV